MAAGDPHNTRLRVWDEEGILSDTELMAADPGELLSHRLERCGSDRAAFVYYLAYRLCQAAPAVTDRLEELMALPADTGLERVSAWMRLAEV